MSENNISTSRLEAFSDGVIAIIITIMVFELKFPPLSDEISLWNEMNGLLPRFISYVISFVMIAIIWVNHHQLFHQINRTDRRFLWLNIHLLFWMTLIPFVTNFIGANPALSYAWMIYSLVFFMNAVSFTLLRSYTIRYKLLHKTISMFAHKKVLRKNQIAMLIYLSSALLCFISVYLSLVLLLIVPAMYFLPGQIEHKPL